VWWAEGKKAPVKSEEIGSESWGLKEEWKN
jgi:hypothetical protein